MMSLFAIHCIARAFDILTILSYFEAILTEKYLASSDILVLARDISVKDSQKASKFLQKLTRQCHELVVSQVSGFVIVYETTQYSTKESWMVSSMKFLIRRLFQINSKQNHTAHDSWNYTYSNTDKLNGAIFSVKSVNNTSLGEICIMSFIISFADGRGIYTATFTRRAFIGMIRSLFYPIQITHIIKCEIIQRKKGNY